MQGMPKLPKFAITQAHTSAAEFVPSPFYLGILGTLGIASGASAPLQNLPVLQQPIA